jgi:hypothetical protein
VIPTAALSWIAMGGQMITMHGLFDLKPGIEVAAYHAAFEAFCRHLQTRGFVAGWSFMRRSPHSGYDRNAPETDFYVSIDFPDRDRAEACYRDVAANEEPLRSLHVAMNSKVEATTTRFVLFETVEGSPTGCT